MARILCIDDNRHGCFARRSLLEGQGHDVVVAHDGAAGIQKFSAEKLDLVIVDYMMPGMSGEEVIRAIRALDSRVPIILHSGYTERLALEEKVMEADAVLHKGQREVKELLDTVDRLLRARAKKPAGRAVARSSKAAKAAPRGRAR
jgi:CheY-like chemotaxis protein